MIIVKLYGDRRNTGGIVSFHNELLLYHSRSENSYRHFRTGRVQSSGLLSNPIVRVLDQVVSYIWFPVYLLWVRPDVIEINSSMVPGAFRRDFLYGWLAQFFRPNTKLVLFNHGWNEDYFSVSIVKQKKKLVRYFSFFDDIVLLTGGFANKVKMLGFKGKTHVITTGIDLASFRKFPTASTDGHVLQLLFLSRVEETKGVGNLLEAMPRILECSPNAELILAGTGGWLAQAKNKVEELGLSKNVIFRGYVRGDDKHRLLAESHIFVFPSYSEGCPISVLEALASGLPIIYTAVGALPDILNDGVNGILIPVRSPDAISKAVTTLAENLDLRSKMRSNNLILAKQFDLSIIHDKLESIYAGNA